MYRIYIVEDDPGIAEGIKQQAKAWGLDGHALAHPQERRG